MRGGYWTFPVHYWVSSFSWLRVMYWVYWYISGAPECSFHWSTAAFLEKVKNLWNSLKMSFVPFDGPKWLKTLQNWYIWTSTECLGPPEVKDWQNFNWMRSYMQFTDLGPSINLSGREQTFSTFFAKIQLVTSKLVENSQKHHCLA